MKDFNYYTPTKVYFGQNSLDNLANELKNYHKVLFHYGKSSIKKIGLYDKIVNILNENNISYVELGGVEANPKLSLVEKGVKLAKEENVDLILAVGGGSVLDSAKSIAAGFYIDESPWVFNSAKKILEKSLPVGAVLTISAAGSEMSNSCVITNDYTNDKRGFGSDLNRPKFAIMNPEYTYSVSKYQTACGVVDILMHTLERFISDDETYNPLTDYIATGLIKAVLEVGLRAYNNPDDYDARATLMWASSLSHNGITACGRTYKMPVHQMEHALSGTYDSVAHGAGLAVLWPQWAIEVAKVNPKPLANLGYLALGIPANIAPNEAAQTTIAILKKYFRDLDMPSTLKEFGVAKEDLPKIANLYTFNRTRTINDFFLLDYDKCLQILEDCYE